MIQLILTRSLVRRRVSNRYVFVSVRVPNLQNVLLLVIGKLAICLRPRWQIDRQNLMLTLLRDLLSRVLILLRGVALQWRSKSRSTSDDWAHV